jgi:polysaccharide export outer membrane protein
LTVYFQPLSFIALGASGKNEEITFEAQGISLSQAFGRIGGLIDGRADSMGVFIFRYEDPGSPVVKPNSPVTEDNLVPVVYQLNMNDPATFFLAQNFPIKNKDIVYVSVASNVELMKFLAIVTSVLAPAVSINNSILIGN